MHVNSIRLYYFHMDFTNCSLLLTTMHHSFQSIHLKLTVQLVGARPREFFLVFLKQCFDYVHSIDSGADPGRGESGSSHGQIFSTLEYFALTFLKILD